MNNYSEKELNDIVSELVIYLAKENDRFLLSEEEILELPYSEKRKVFYQLCSARNPKPLSSEFLRLQNEFLTYENKNRNIVDVDKLNYINNMSIFLGDIVSLKADAIVCSCKENLIGTLRPQDDSISNDVLFAGGLQVKQELNYIITKQNKNEECGQAKIIKGYNLSSKYIICTVGPKIINGRVGYREKEGLINCYKSCLELAYSKGLKTIAFCSISTGSNKFPKQLASEIAISTVSKWLEERNYPFKVVFCLECEDNKALYENSFINYVRID